MPNGDKNDMFSENEKIIDNSTTHKQSQIDEIKSRRDAKRRRKKIRRILLIVLIVAVCGGAIYGAFYLSNKNDIIFNDNPVQQGEATPSPAPSYTPEPSIAPTLAPSPVPTEQAVAVVPDTDQATQVTSTEKPVKTKTPVATKKPTTAPAASKSISNELVLAGEAVKDESTGAFYSSVSINNKQAYLKLTQAGESGYVLVSADASDEKYNNSPVYVPSALTSVPSSDFLIADSAEKALTIADLAGMSKEQLALARNEIYARHGRRFKTEAYQKYFESKSWYKENPNYKYNNDELNISELENKNAHFILDYERR